MGADPDCYLSQECRERLQVALTSKSEEFVFAMAAAPFYFQILLAGLKGVSPEVANRSIVIEVSPEEISQSALAGEREKPERDLAERIARRVAAEVIQGESVSGPEESDSIAQIGSLPDDLREKSPTLQRGAVRAWLV